MKVIYSLIILASSISLFSQRGKDGTVTITVANSIVNIYTPLTANAATGNTSISVVSSASYNIGDLVMIIQMQGAGVKASFDNLSGDYSNSIPENTSHGEILAYNNCGNYEFAEITDIPSLTSIVLDCGLKHAYDVSYNTNANPFGYSVTLPGKVQVIKVPRYSTLTVSSPGFLTCPSWDGNTGGIVVVEVENNTVLNNTPSINATGKGFRGGPTDSNTASNFGGQKWGTTKTAEGAYKGESIAGDTAVYRLYASIFGRGAIANGGGGGTSHNSGGGGGANGGNITNYNGYGNPTTGTTLNPKWDLESLNFSANTSSGGGKGGYSFSSSNQNVTTKAPGNTSWGGDNRRNVGGMGGRPLDYSTGRLFIGGGGGAGDGNDNQAGAGGNGGGMVYIVCYGNLSGAGTIVADGANGANSVPGCSTNDAAAGGGGGGTIVLNVNGTTNLTAFPTVLTARGGNGGNVAFNCFLSNSDAYGPGGGGGGGHICSAGLLPTNNPSGGANGMVTGNTSNIAANFPPNGATNGGVGSYGSISNYTLNTSASQTVCANQSFSISASSTEPGTTVNWFNSLVGGAAIANGSTYVSPGYSSAGTYTLFAGVCPGTYRQPIIITVNSGLSISVNSATVCPGQSTILTPTSVATSYTWSTAQTTTTISVSPATTTVYTVTGSNGSCSGTQTATVTIGSGLGVSVSSATVCAGTTTVLTASGATTYTWNTGANTSTITVSPASTTVYTVSGSVGTCTGSSTSTVNILALPVLTVTGTPSTLCVGQSAILNVSGANTYTWSNAVTGSSQTVTPITSTSYSVSGINGAGCTSASVSVNVTVSSNPTVSVNSSTVCAGQSATLTATGSASSYIWNTTQTTNSISVSPAATTVYTVTGSTSGCNTSQTATVTIGGALSISVNNPTICPGQSAVLTPTSSAVSYTWSTSQTSNTISVAPTTTTVYIVSGNSGTCNGVGTSTVFVSSAGPAVTANSATICAGQNASLTANGATSYTWSTGATTSVINPSPSTTTNYTVSGSNGGCATDFVTTVSVRPSPVVLIASNITAGCGTVCVNFKDTGNFAINVISYTFGDGSTGNLRNPTHCYPAAGSYTVSATATDPATGCSASFILPSPIVVNTNTKALFSITEGTMVTLGTPVHLVNSSTNATSYLWTLCNNSMYTTTDLTTSSLDTGKCCIKLVAKTGGSCKDSVTHCITVIDEMSINIPNVFTPNNDSRNDIFNIKTSGIKSLSCSIYDRWGLKMYEWEGINGYWDGKTKAGVPSVDGSYFYIIDYTDFKDVSKTEKGFLSLFRN